MLSPSLLPATTASALLKHLYHRDHHLVYVYVNWERWQHINVHRWVAESVDCQTKWTREPSTDWILRRETECLDRSTVTDCRQTSTQTDRQTLRHTDRQTQRHTDRHTHTHRNKTRQLRCMQVGSWSQSPSPLVWCHHMRHTVVQNSSAWQIVCLEQAACFTAVIWKSLPIQKTQLKTFLFSKDWAAAPSDSCF